MIRRDLNVGQLGDGRPLRDDSNRAERVEEHKWLMIIFLLL